MIFSTTPWPGQTFTEVLNNIKERPLKLDEKHISKRAGKVMGRMLEIR